MSTDEVAQPAVEFSAVASRDIEPLHADGADFSTIDDSLDGTIDEDVEEDRADDPDFDLSRDVSL